MTSSERIGSALNSGNLKMDDLHADADLIAALAFVSRLGQRLQHVASGGYMSELGPAINELARVLKKACSRKRMGLSMEDAHIVATQAMREWLIKICRTCNGTGERLMSYAATGGKQQRKGQCPHCSGTGLFIPTWRWRRDVMAIHAREVPREWWEKRIELGKEIAEDAYRSAQRKVSIQMTEI